MQITQTEGSISISLIVQCNDFFYILGMERTEEEVDMDMKDALQYVHDCPGMWKEAKHVFKAEHVIMVGLEKYLNPREFTAAAAVIRSSNPLLKPHQLNLQFSINVAEWKLTCSCKAGSSKCKHIGATLFYILK